MKQIVEYLIDDALALNNTDVPADNLLLAFVILLANLDFSDEEGRHVHRGYAPDRLRRLSPRVLHFDWEC